MFARGVRGGSSGIDPIFLMAIVLLVVNAFTGNLVSPVSRVLRNPASPQAWQVFLSFVVAIFLAIAVHEFMHAYVAHREGDDTGKLMGRLTLNPFAHFDLFGSVLILVAGFGYGKPVPFNEARLRGPFSVSLLALAGPLSNFVLAAICAIPLRLLPDINEMYGTLLLYCVSINCLLGVFNLLPIPPLDGANVVYGLLSPSARWSWRTYQQYGPMLLILLLLLGGPILYTLVQGPAQFLESLLLGPGFQ